MNDLKERQNREVKRQANRGRSALYQQRKKYMRRQVLSNDQLFVDEMLESYYTN